MKPRVILTTTDYRIARDRWGYNLVETRDGCDTLGVQRWRPLTSEEYGRALSVIVDQIGDAITENRRRAAKARRTRARKAAAEEGDDA